MSLPPNFNPILAGIPRQATKYQRFLHIVRAIQPVTRPALIDAAIAGCPSTKDSVLWMISKAAKDGAITADKRAGGQQYTLGPKANLPAAVEPKPKPTQAPPASNPAAAAKPAPKPPKTASEDDDDTNPVRDELRRHAQFWMTNQVMPDQGWTCTHLANVLSAERADLANALRDMVKAGAIERHPATAGGYIYSLPGQDVSHLVAQGVNFASILFVRDEPPAADPVQADPPTPAAAKAAHVEETKGHDASHLVSSFIDPEKEDKAKQVIEGNHYKALDLLAEFEESGRIGDRIREQISSMWKSEPEPVGVATHLRRQLVDLDDLIGEACDTEAPHRAIRCIHSASAALRHALEALS